MSDRERHPMLNVMRAYHVPMTREKHLNTVYAGNPPVDEAGDLPAELEGELPEQFQRGETVIMRKSLRQRRTSGRWSMHSSRLWNMMSRKANESPAVPERVNGYFQDFSAHNSLRVNENNQSYDVQDDSRKPVVSWIRQNTRRRSL